MDGLVGDERASGGFRLSPARRVGAAPGGTGAGSWIGEARRLCENAQVGAGWLIWRVG